MSFTNQILQWYKIYRRDLPWRGSSDPYFIWISEVILQQTRVEQGLSYYLNFVKAYPDIKSLAEAREEDVLKLWQGLGYYSRARNMLYAAKQVVNDHQGCFPDNYSDLITLKGVGSYTAAAIASIAFKEVIGVVDGNVKRVLARIFGLKDSGKQLNDAAFDIMMKYIDPQQPGEFNQAVMEFGALHCTPSQPACGKCIFKEICYANINGMQKALPAKEKKAIVKKRYFAYLVIEDPLLHGIIIKKRSGNDIWKNLYEFPLIEIEHEISVAQLLIHPQFKALLGEDTRIDDSSKEYKHQLSHQTIFARFHNIKADIKLIALPEACMLIEKDKLVDYPIPRLIELYLEDL